MIRASSGISLALEPVRVALAVEALVAGADDRPHVLELLDRGEDPLAELGMRLDQRALRRRSAARAWRGSRRGSRSCRCRGTALRARRASAPPCSSPSSSPTFTGHVPDPAGVRRGVLVLRLERVRERLDGREERSLERLERERVRERHLRLAGDARRAGRAGARRGRPRCRARAPAQRSRTSSAIGATAYAFGERARRTRRRRGARTSSRPTTNGSDAAGAGLGALPGQPVAGLARPSGSSSGQAAAALEPISVGCRKPDGGPREPEDPGRPARDPLRHRRRAGCRPRARVRARAAPSRRRPPVAAPRRAGR